MRIETWSLAAVFALACPAANAQAPATPAPKASLLLPVGEHKVASLVELVGRYGRFNLLCDPVQIKDAKPIKLTSPVEISGASCLDALSSLLYTQNLVLLPVDESKGVFEVVALYGVRGSQGLESSAVERSVEDILASPDSKRYVCTTVSLQHQNAQMINNTIMPLLSGGRPRMAIGASANGRALILRGFQNQVAAAIRLVKTNDQPGVAVPPRVAARVAKLEKQVAVLQTELAKLRKALERK